MSKTTAVKEAKAATFTLITGTADIEKALASIKTRGAALQQDIHKAGCSVLAHVGKHKDIRLVTKLLDAMPDMARKNAIKAWFESFGPVIFAEDGKIAYHPATSLRLGDAMAMPFWRFKPEQAYVPMNVGQALDQLIKKLEKDHKETGNSHLAIVAGLSKLREQCPEEGDVRAAANAKVAAAVTAAPAPKATRKAKDATTAPVADVVATDATTAPEAIAA
jgi:hypothetical protein